MKKKNKRKSKYYLVVDKSRGYTHGAFPFTEEGLIMAKDFVKSASEKTNEELIIKNCS